MSTWWHAHNEHWGAHADESPDDARLPDHLVALLDDMEARFVTAGGSSMGWADPHVDPTAPGGYRMPTEDEYSRLTHPEHYAILEVRLTAWLDVVRARGLGHITSQSGATAMDFDVLWPGSGLNPPSQIVSVHPTRGGPTMHCAAWRDIGACTTVEVALGDDVVVALLTPDCPCDACDSGSADLLEEFDRTLLAVVDGSIEISVVGGQRSMRTAWSSESGSDWRRPDGSPDQHVRGASWLAGHDSLPLAEPMSTSDMPAMNRIAWRAGLARQGVVATYERGGAGFGWKRRQPLKPLCAIRGLGARLSSWRHRA